VFYDVVAIARDWSLILLVLEGMLLCALPLVILLQVTKWLRGFLPRVRPALKNAHASVVRVSMGIDRALAAMRAPILWAEGLRARVRGIYRVWKRA
jgi:hypothetical protein